MVTITKSLRANERAFFVILARSPIFARQEGGETRRFDKKASHAGCSQYYYIFYVNVVFI